MGGERGTASPFTKPIFTLGLFPARHGLRRCPITRLAISILILFQARSGLALVFSLITITRPLNDHSPTKVSIQNAAGATSITPAINLKGPVAYGGDDGRDGRKVTLQICAAVRGTKWRTDWLLG